MTCCSPTPSAWWFATSAARARSRTRATASTQASLPELLRVGSLKTVYHGAAASLLTLKELVRSYNSLVEDTTRVMLRIKALFRACVIQTPGRSVYSPSKRKEWLDQLQTPSARVRAASLLTQLDLLLELRPKAKTTMIAEARKQPGWKPLRSIPFLGVIRVAQLLAIATPHRFRTKRDLWPYAGLAVVTRSSADQEFVGGTLRRSARPPRTRGLNRNHNPMLKSIFKEQPPRQQRRRTTPGPVRGLCRTRHQAGVGEGDAGAQDRLDRIAPVEERRALGSGQADDANGIALGGPRSRMRATASVLDADPSRWFRSRGEARGSLSQGRH
jgi:hypothetical protein